MLSFFSPFFILLFAPPAPIFAAYIWGKCPPSIHSLFQSSRGCGQAQQLWQHLMLFCSVFLFVTISLAGWGVFFTVYIFRFCSSFDSSIEVQKGNSAKYWEETRPQYGFHHDCIRDFFLVCFLRVFFRLWETGPHEKEKKKKTKALNQIFFVAFLRGDTVFFININLCL